MFWVDSGSVSSVSLVFTTNKSNFLCVTVASHPVHANQEVVLLKVSGQLRPLLLHLKRSAIVSAYCLLQSGCRLVQQCVFSVLQWMHQH